MSTDDTTSTDEPRTEEPCDEDDQPALDDLPLTIIDPPTTMFTDMAGLTDTLERLNTAVLEPMIGPARTTRTHGVLIHGPNGTGKSRLAESLAGELAAHNFTVARFNGSLGTPDIEAKFEQSLNLLADRGPAVVLLDPLTATVNQHYQAALKHALSRLNAGDDRILLIGVINPEESMGQTPAVFDSFEVKSEVPQPAATRRQQIIQTTATRLCQHEPVDITVESIDFPALSAATDGLSVVDLETVCERAVHLAIADESAVTQDSIDMALEAVQSEIAFTTNQSGSDWRDGIINPDVPNVSFDDIGGLTDAKTTLQQYLDIPTQYADVYDAFDLPTSHGVLLHGPLGNGKTMLAKAVANEADRTLVTVNGPELQNKYVGTTEKRIRDVFTHAREEAPSVLFFDEFDAVAPNRNTLSRAYRIGFVNTLLAELDGMAANDDVLVIAATNRRDAIDPAVLRPGRLGDQIEIGVPSDDSGQSIVAATTRDHPLADDVTPDWIAAQFTGTPTGADIAGVCRAALEEAIRDAGSAGNAVSPSDVIVTRGHYQQALKARAAVADDSDAIGFV